jgi:hypothetical protein
VSGVLLALATLALAVIDALDFSGMATTRDF